MNTDRRALLALVVVMMALCLLCFFAAANWRVHQAANSGDSLLWLREEFQLSPDELSRIRVLHNGYLPSCEEMCARIAAKKAEVIAELAAAGDVTPQVRSKLAEAAELHAECQARMLAHFHEVSRAMPPEQGRRYLAEMKRFVLEEVNHTGHGMMPESNHHAGHGGH